MKTQLAPPKVKEEREEKNSDDKREPAVGFVHTTNLPSFFQQLRISLIVTTYQAQRVMTFSAPSPEKLFMLMRVYPRPTGIALRKDALALCSKNQIWFFRNATDVHDDNGTLMPYDRIYVPRYSHVTGDIAAHQLAWYGDDLIVVNTRFSCLCTLHPDWSFVPGWRPPFITAYAPDDRCHLNGLCLNARGPKYASALGMTNTSEGWRDKKASGGVIIDIPSGEVVARELSMPHTPVLYQDKLWILESGTGALLLIDQQSGRKTEITRLPGFLRGLAFYERYAFIGLCKIREKKTFGGLPIEEMVADLKCAIYVVDITTGSHVGFIEFTKGIEELFDLQVLAGVQNPHILGFEEDTVDRLMVIPPQFL